jgi:hypothetical protein
MRFLMVDETGAIMQEYGCVTAYADGVNIGAVTLKVTIPGENETNPYPEREDYDGAAAYVDAVEEWESAQDPKPDPWRTIDASTGEFRDATAEETRAMRIHNASVKFPERGDYDNHDAYMAALKEWEDS